MKNQRELTSRPITDRTMKWRIIYAARLLLAITIAALPLTGTVSGSTHRSLSAAFLLEAQQTKRVELTIVATGQDQKPVGGARVEITHDALGPEFRANDYFLETDANGVATTDIVIGNKWGEGSLYWPVVDIVVTKGELRGRGRVTFKATYYRNPKTGEWGSEKERDGVRFAGPDYRPETSNIVMKATDQMGVGLVSVNVHVARENGDPADGAKVVISGSPSERYQGITGASGDTTIRVPVIFKKKYDITASKPGYKSAESVSVIELDDKRSADAVMLVISRVAGVAVTIRVKDQGNNSGVGDASVILDGGASKYYADTTDGSGTANFFIPEPGRFSVRITQKNYEPLNDGELLLEAEETKAAEFVLKAKPKKVEGRNSIAVTVLQGDRVERIAGYNLPLPDAVVKAGSSTETTNRSGKATLSDFFEDTVEVVVEASGYKRQAKSVQISEQQRYSGGTADVTFMMYPEASEDIIEVRVTSKDKDSSGPLAGVTVTAGDQSATTRSDGWAKLTGDFPDSVEVVVEKSGYLRQSRTINASSGKGIASFTMQTEPDEDSVTIMVAAADPKGGGASPISGAVVSANGFTATTDGGGRATITGNFKDGVDVEVKASGFVAQTQKVTIKQPERTGAANFLLQPVQSLRLIVEVLDSASPNKPLEGASVYVFRLGTQAQPLAVKETNKQGEATIELKGSAEQLSQIRSGLTLHVVGTDEYEKKKLSDIQADQLLPSTEARRVTVFLNREWAGLRKAIDALEPRVFAWNNDIARVTRARDLARKLAEQAQQSKDRVAALLSEIEYAGKAAAGVNGISAISLQCREAARLKSNILGYKSEAAAKEQALKTALNNASAMAANCSSVKDGEAIKRMYREAIQLTAAIGALEKKAVQDGNELKKLANENNDLKKIIAEVEKKVAEIAREASKAELAVAAVGPFVPDESLTKTLSSRHAALTGELQTLKTTYNLDKYVEGLPSDLIKRVDVMTQLLKKQNPGLDWPKTVQEVSFQLQQDKARAEKYLTSYKSGTDGNCDVEPADDLIREIGSLTTSATIEIAAAADLPNKAAECAKRGACMPLIDEVRTLLRQGAIEAAETKLNQARAQGCDLSALPGGASLVEELDYYKSLNEAVALLKTAQSNCKFQEALDWAARLPESIRSQPLIANTLTQVRSGLDAQQRVQRLRVSARDAVTRGGTVTAAEPLIRQAEQIAAPYPCLVEEVSTFRNEYPATGKIDQEPTDEVPGALGENKAKKENPTDEIPTALGGLTGTLGSSRPPFRPPGDKKPEMPTDEVPGALGSSTGRPPVRDDSRRRGGSTGDGTTGGSGGTATSSGGAGAQGQRPCDANENAAFAQMTGNWSAGPKITISGSCEKASGTAVWAEYCENPDRTDNPGLARYKTTFTGRMEGASLQINWDRPGGALHKDAKGTASCSVGRDGTLSCSGLGCGISGAKKQ